MGCPRSNSFTTNNACVVANCNDCYDNTIVQAVIFPHVTDLSGTLIVVIERLRARMFYSFEKNDFEVWVQYFFSFKSFLVIHNPSSKYFCTFQINIVNICKIMLMELTISDYIICKNMLSGLTGIICYMLFSHIYW